MHTDMFATSIVLLTLVLSQLQVTMGQSGVMCIYPSTSKYGGEKDTYVVMTDGDACSQACFVDPHCTAADFNTEHQHCFRHDNETIINGNTVIYNTYQYKKEPTGLNCPQLTMCRMPGMSVDWGTPRFINAGTEFTCRDACRIDRSCLGVDWVFSSRECRKHTIATINFDRNPHSGSVHYRKEAAQANCMICQQCGTNEPNVPCQSPCFLRSYNTSVLNGTPWDVFPTEQSCIAACRTDPQCQGIDWDEARDECWRHTAATVNGDRDTAFYGIHYKKQTRGCDCVWPLF